MNEDKNIKETILQRAERVMHYNNLLINQCEGWLSAEEGNENLRRKIRKQLTINN